MTAMNKFQYTNGQQFFRSRFSPTEISLMGLSRRHPNNVLQASRGQKWDVRGTCAGCRMSYNVPFEIPYVSQSCPAGFPWESQFRDQGGHLDVLGNPMGRIGCPLDIPMSGAGCPVDVQGTSLCCLG